MLKVARLWRLVKKKTTYEFMREMFRLERKNAFLFVSSDDFMLKSAVRPLAACFYRISTHFICSYYLGHFVWAVTQHGSYLWLHAHTRTREEKKKKSNDVLCIWWHRVGRLVSCQRTLSLLKTSTWPRTSRRLDERQSSLHGTLQTWSKALK